MNIATNQTAEDILHQQQLCDKSDILLLATGSTEILIGNIAIYALLAEAPTIGSALRWSAAFALSTLATAVTFVGRNHEYDVLDAFQGKQTQLPIARQQG